MRNKIPVKTDSSKIKDSVEAKALSEELSALEKHKDQVVEITNKIFQTLNEDNIIPQMLQVLSKKTTEIAVFKENKIKYEEMVKELERLNNEIQNIKNNVAMKNETFVNVKALAIKPNPQNEQVRLSLHDTNY